MHTEHRLKFILASASSRRQQILSSLGIEYDVFVPVVDENAFLKPPFEKAAELIAVEKVRSCIKGENTVVIGADTIVVVDRTVLGKPVDEEDAKRMLKLLSNREHKVITGVAVSYNGKVFSDKEVTSVRFTNLTERDIDFYIKTGEPMGKAGAYAIQGYGSLFVKQIKGCYFNVVGLPVFRLRCVLKEAGIELTNFLQKG